MTFCGKIHPEKLSPKSKGKSEGEQCLTFWLIVAADWRLASRLPFAIIRPVCTGGDDPATLFSTGDGPTLLKGIIMAWGILFLAGLFEVAWAIGLKYSHGLTRLWPTVGTVLAMALSVWLLGLALKSLPLGTAYSIWVGIGAVGTVVLGIVLFGESASAARLISVALIIGGIIGLKLASS